MKRQYVRRKYTKELLSELVKKSFAFSEVLRALGRPQSGGMHTHIRGLVRKFEIDTSHFLGIRYNYGKHFPKRTAIDILVAGIPEDTPPRAALLRRALLEIGRKHQCEGCGCENKWCDQPLVLEIDHKNGLRHDNRAENLRFLCPNCHSQTSNYGIKNKASLAELADVQSLDLCVHSDVGVRVSHEAPV